MGERIPAADIKTDEGVKNLIYSHIPDILVDMSPGDEGGEKLIIPTLGLRGV
jgi:hypothetical protein